MSQVSGRYWEFSDEKKKRERWKSLTLWNLDLCGRSQAIKQEEDKNRRSVCVKILIRITEKVSLRKYI